MPEIFRPRVFKRYNGNSSRAARYSVTPCNSITDSHVSVAHFIRLSCLNLFCQGVIFFSTVLFQISTTYPYLRLFFFPLVIFQLFLYLSNMTYFYCSLYISIVQSELALGLPHSSERRKAPSEIVPVASPDRHLPLLPQALHFDIANDIEVKHSFLSNDSNFYRLCRNLQSKGMDVLENK